MSTNNRKETNEIPIDPRHLFKPLNDKLIALLKKLQPADWNKQTVAKKWKVKDVISHILDAQLRVLSIQRDRYFGEDPPLSSDYIDVVTWLNMLNADWVKACKRLSPSVLILLLESIGDMVIDYYWSLDPWEEAIFSVDWAGESTSYNWMHVAREYTEFWHHQQQIREAVGIDGIMDKAYFYPVINTFFQALPYTFKNVEAVSGSCVKIVVLSEAGGIWYLIRREDSWQLVLDSEVTPSVVVKIPAEISWVLFTKSVRASDIIDQIEMIGDDTLGQHVLEMVSVMA